MLVVTAPGHKRFETTFTIDGDAYRASVDVPLLALLPKDAVARRGPTLEGQHIAGIVSGGIGVIGVAVGAGLVSAQSSWSDAEASCPRPDRCTADGAAAATDAGRGANLSTLGFVVGGVGLGLGAILFATGPSLVVAPAPEGAVASVRFRWP